MTRFRSLAASLLVAGVLAGGAVFAQGPGFNTGPRGDNPGPGFAGRGGRGGGSRGAGDVGLPLQQLNLSDAQQQQVRDLVERRLTDNKDVQDRLRSAQDAMRKAEEALPMNEGAIRAAAQNLALAEADAAVQRAQLRSEVFALLTPDQQASVKRLQADRESREGQRLQRLEERRDRVQERLQKK